VDSNFCSLFKGTKSCFYKNLKREGVKFFPILFLGVFLSFNFDDPEKDRRILGVQVIGFMSSRDKVLLDDLFMFKELEKNLTHFISKLLDLCRVATRGCSMVFSCLRSQKRT
jgi:hypothetical protein